LPAESVVGKLKYEPVMNRSIFGGNCFDYFFRFADLRILDHAGEFLLQVQAAANQNSCGPGGN
jgi:hypothetical protein